MPDMYDKLGEMLNDVLESGEIPTPRHCEAPRAPWQSVFPPAGGDGFPRRAYALPAMTDNSSDLSLRGPLGSGNPFPCPVV